LSQSQTYHVSIFVNHLFRLVCRNIKLTLNFQVWHQYAITKIKRWVQIIGANIGSFAESLHPYLWDIQMVVGTKQFFLYVGPG
jgi:hypothetical protein